MTDQLERESTDLEVLAGQLDRAIARADDLDPAARTVFDDAVGALEGLHKQGLTTIITTLRADPRGKELLFGLVDDPTVRMLFAMHGLIRPSPQVLARQIVDRLRPGLQGHGGDVELSHIDGSVVYVRLTGACNGCSRAAVTMRDTVESALTAGIPGITSVQVLPNEPAPTFIPLSSLSSPASAGAATGSDESGDLAAAGWSRTLRVADVPVGELRAVSVRTPDTQAHELVLVNAAGSLAAYVNACAHQGLPLDDAVVDADEGTIICPWHGFCYDATSGECTSLPGAQLSSVPLKIVGGHAWVRPGG